MTKKTEKEVLITLDFSGTEKKFTNIDALREFLRSQRNDWSWLEQTAQEDSNLMKVYNPIGSYLAKIGNFIGWYEMNRKSQISHAAQTKMVNEFISGTQTAVKQGFILYGDHYTPFISSLKDSESPQVAGYALALLNNVSINLNTSAAYKGSYWAMQYLMGMRGDPAEQQQKVFDAVVEGHISKLANECKDLVNSTKRKLIDLETTFKEKLIDLETSFKERISLKSSVGYWTQKRDSHQNVMWIMAVTTVAIAVLTGVFFVMEAEGLPSLNYILQSINADTKTGQVQTTGTTTVQVQTTGTTTVQRPTADPEKISGGQLSIMIVISTIGIWLTRLSGKIFLSNLHLRTDADERVTMIQTYLALLENKGLNEGERELILQALFRSSSSGFIKDDGPINILETLIKTLKRR